jgi:hypothetical protein
MKRAAALAGFAFLVAVGTQGTGWWLVPLLAAAWARAFPREPATVTTCALGAAVGWGMLLAWGAVHGPIGTVARRVGGVFMLPGWGFVGVTLMFAAALAGAAVLVVRPARSG